jgi:hypothetical protein
VVNLRPEPVLIHNPIAIVAGPAVRLVFHAVILLRGACSPLPRRPLLPSSLTCRPALTRPIAKFFMGSFSMETSAVMSGLMFL